MIPTFSFLQTKLDSINSSAAKSDPFFGLNMILDTKFGLGLVGSGWP